MVVQRTDAATRCGLQGSYWLQVGREALLLRETQTKNIVREWPYELLRRYGKDKVSFSIGLRLRLGIIAGVVDDYLSSLEHLITLTYFI